MPLVSILILVLDGPFGPVRSLANKGETAFGLSPQVRDGSWCTTLGPSLAFFPRDRPAGSPQKEGQVLLDANYHWLANRRAWTLWLLERPRQSSAFIEPGVLGPRMDDGLQLYL